MKRPREKISSITQASVGAETKMNVWGVVDLFFDAVDLFFWSCDLFVWSFDLCFWSFGLFFWPFWSNPLSLGRSFCLIRVFGVDLYFRPDFSGLILFSDLFRWSVSAVDLFRWSSFWSFLFALAVHRWSISVNQLIHLLEVFEIPGL